MHKVDISLKVTDDSQKNSDSSLTLGISGDSVDHSVVNALRRVVLTDIPIYGFYRSYMEIEKNTSIFNNDQMRLRLGMIPIPKLSTNIDFLDKKHYPYISGVYGSIKPDKEIEKHPDDDMDIHLYITASNPEQDELNVTSNDCKVYVNLEEKADVYDSENPLLIIKLRRNEEFKCHLSAKLGIAKLNNCWASVGTCYYDRIADNNYTFTMESLGQLSETEIFQKACRIILFKLETTRDFFKALPPDEETKSDKLIVKMEGENHTLGNLLTTTLQRHQKVLEAGYKMEHPSVDEIVIEITGDKTKPLKIMFEVIDYLKELFEKLSKSLGKSDKPKDINKKKKKLSRTKLSKH